uniref:PAS domain-containing protein n=1 Tax=Aureoumbra lagunensis TaxID=44058 RepID=A0A7S3NL50_9STRA
MEESGKISNIRYALGRVAWLLDGSNSVKMMLNCPDMRDVIKGWVDLVGHPILQMHSQFVAEALRLERLNLSEKERQKEVRELHKRKHQNPMFYCTTTDIEYGYLDKTDWIEVCSEMDRAIEVSCAFLSEHLLPRLLGSSIGKELAIRADWHNLIIKQADYPSMVLDAAKSLIDSTVCVYDEENKNMHGIVPDALGGIQILNDFLQAEAALVAGCVNGNISVSQIPISHQGVTKYRVIVLVDMVPSQADERLAKAELFLEYLPSTTSCDSANDIARGLAVSSLPDYYDDDAPAMSALGMRVDPLITKGEPLNKPTSIATNLVIGENVDMYGKAFGKKHQDVAEDISTKAPIWFENASYALDIILKHEQSRSIFQAFLDSEHRRPPLDFYLQVEEQLINGVNNQSEQEQVAKKITLEYNCKLARAKLEKHKANPNKDKVELPCLVTKDKDLTSDTSDIWKKFYDASCTNDDNTTNAYNWVHEAKSQAGQVFKMLVVDSFTRFILSKDGKKKLNQVATESELVHEALNKNPLLPKNVEEWMTALIAIIEQWPACTVVSDMTIAGAPMIYVNPMFLKTTRYEYAQVVGRNCRFLQGPATEAQGIDIIRRTLKGGRDCHVLLTNYRKDGTLFKNLLTMRPIFDADGIYRYCIGVQFEIKDATRLQLELGRLDKLLQLLPCLVPFQGTIHEAAHLPQSCLDGTVTPTSPHIQDTEKNKIHKLQENQRFAATKISWLLHPRKTLEIMLHDPLGIVALDKYMTRRSPLGRSALEFCRIVEELLVFAQKEQAPAVANKFSKFETILTNFSELTSVNTDASEWTKLLEQLSKWRELWLNAIQKSSFRSFLNTFEAAQLFEALRARENEEDPTCANLLYASLYSGASCEKKLKTILSYSSNQESFFLDMIHAISLSLGSDVGLVVSDMRTPGLPLIYTSSGFIGVTGYGKEQIGCPCSFLQGPKSEEYIIEEIVDALRYAESTYVKIINYKQTCEPFQCCLALCPIFTANKDEYIFQIGLQIDVTDPKRDQLSRLGKLADFLRFLPKTVASAPYPSPAVQILQ